MNDTTSNNTPKQKNAAIFSTGTNIPDIEYNNLSKVNVKRLSEMIRSVLSL